MHRLSVLLVEDDVSAALDVEMLLDEMGLKLAAKMDNSEDALKYIYNEQPDLIIMDVELKGEKSGMDLAKEITHLRIPIIFTTSFKDKTIFEASKSVNSIGYLVKPFDKLSLQSIMEQAAKTIFPDDALETATNVVGSGTILSDTLLVKHGTLLYPVRFNDIYYIQGEGNYCSIHTECRKYMVKLSLRKILEALPSAEFVPVHKSFIVRLNKVSAVDVGSGKLTVGKDTLPLGRNFKNSFLECFNILK
jgi:DNA-binding LytR/AlgR family response regulator